MKPGDNIRKYRKLKKLTQKELANIIEKSVRMVQKYESNEVTPSLEVIEEIAKALDVESWDLLVGSKEGKTIKEYREEATNKMLDDFKMFAKNFGYDFFKYGDEKYIVSSPEFDDELLITKNELLDIHKNVMAYTKFTLDHSFEKLNDNEHKSPLQEINVVEEDEMEG